MTSLFDLPFEDEPEADGERGEPSAHERRPFSRTVGSTGSALWPSFE